jgi:uncharacterized protein
MKPTENKGATVRERKAETGKPPAATDIQVRLVPRSSRTELLGREGETYRIKVTAPPVDGKANAALVEFLAKKLGVGKGKIQIVSGALSRLKRVRIAGLSPEEIAGRLEK